MLGENQKTMINIITMFSGKKSKVIFLISALILTGITLKLLTTKDSTDSDDEYWAKRLEICLSHNVNEDLCNCEITVAKKHINAEIAQRYDDDPYADLKLSEEERPKMKKYYDEFHAKCGEMTKH